MSKIDAVKTELQNNGYFFHDCGTNYVRVLDTPHVWGMPFGDAIMPQAIRRQGEFERAIVEMVQHARYRCDVASLNCPDPDWGKAILGAIDTALTTQMGRTQPTQFRFLFGQTPNGLQEFALGNTQTWGLVDFKAALIRLIRARAAHWELMPDIWIGRFYQFAAGAFASLSNAVLPAALASDDDTKMTWNHSKIIAVDGAEALVGGHNLNMDLFRSYPPVHDVSVVVHGAATYGSQLFLNQMWNVGSDLLSTEYLDTLALAWIPGAADGLRPDDPFAENEVQTYMTDRQHSLIEMHQLGLQPDEDPPAPEIPPMPAPEDIRNHDLRSLADLDVEVLQERIIYNRYEKFEDYKKATRMLSVGKYWTGPIKETDFKRGSELMKRNLILNAKRIIRMSQMDLISAWKKSWSDHVVCHWLMEALLRNKYLNVQVVVSPLDAGAGAGGDQYSFGSGAIRTFQLIEYYMRHNIDDTVIPDPDGARAHALDRLFIAPLFYTDQVPDNMLIEGQTYQWPNLSPEGYTLTLKRPLLTVLPPSNGIIGNPVESLKDAGGLFGRTPVPSAPGNHAKIMIIDDELYVVGSDNLYPGNLSEFNYLIEGEAVQELLSAYWEPLWRYSGPHAVNPCRQT